VDIEGLDLTSAVRQLARETATNLVIDPRVVKEAQGKVTLQVEDVPLDTAVRLLSEMVGLKPVKVGNTLFICSKATAKDLREDETPPQPGVPQVIPDRMVQPPGNLVVPQLPGPGGVVPTPTPAP
jgi:type II secretory pathway component GspD/PulD (secretin)